MARLKYIAGLIFNMRDIKMPKLLQVIICCMILQACSGLKKTIKSTQAYAMALQQGTVQANENETLPVTPSTTISIYVQANSFDLQFDTCWINNKAYAVKMQKINHPLELGTDKVSEQKITVIPDEEGCMYQLQVGPLSVEGKELAGATVRIRLSHKQRQAYQTTAPIRIIKDFDRL